MDASPAPAPRLSVVVVPFGGRALLASCLQALERQTARAEIEIVVAGDGRHDFDELARRFPRVFFDRVAGRRTWAEMRAAAVRRTGAPVVALTEAQCSPDREWAARILAAHEADHAAIGGAVDKREGTIVGWAMYFCDYARYAPPMPAARATALTDCNVSYKRSDLEPISKRWAGEFHEPTVHAALIERRRSLWLDPGIVVHHLRAPSLRQAVRDRLDFGRLFGATRVAGVGPGRRGLLAIAAPLVPLLIVGRASVGVLHRGRHLGRLVPALPAMLLLASTWAFGELVGTVTGRAGALAGGAPAEVPH